MKNQTHVILWYVVNKGGISWNKKNLTLVFGIVRKW